MKEIINQDKMAALLGLTKNALLKKNDTEKWVNLRLVHQKEGRSRQDEIDMARSIFKAWDAKEKGYLSLQEFTERLLTIGLSTEQKFVEILLHSMKA